MSYTAHAYRDMSKIISDEIESIYEDDLMKDEIDMSLTAVKGIAVGMADLFTADNPKGFDRDRFFRDAGINFE